MEETLRMTAIFLFWFLQKFSICYHKSFYGRWCSPIVTSSRVRIVVSTNCRSWDSELSFDDITLVRNILQVG